MIAILLGVLDASAPAVTQDQRIEQARQAALTDDYQATLPGQTHDNGTETSPTSAKPDEHPTGPWRGGDPNESYSRHETQERDTGAVGTVIKFLLWGVLFVVIAIGVFWIGSELLSRGDDAKLDEADAKVKEAKPIDEAVVERPLGDADELARRGEFAEAIHTLLLRTLQELVRSAALRVAPATTSREILARVPLLADARERARRPDHRGRDHALRRRAGERRRLRPLPPAVQPVRGGVSRAGPRATRPDGRRR